MAIDQIAQTGLSSLPLIYYLEQLFSEIVAQIAKTAYLETWKIMTVAEICALVADDADTLATLLLAEVTLCDFTKERFAWYLQGRLPFGYQGNYPTGEWLIL
ncbi:hypothetical protein AAEH95_15585 [Shewanella xiamenensis]|uniref:hypothetical protein n=1 Tax=Shewanella xiamenensis TaxID=332186 RepID=UPI00313DBC2D